MAARSIASLTIAFGLVAIPVKLYSATVSCERLRFHMLHAKDGSRLKQQYVCAEEQRVVPRAEIVKGYEFAKDQYVMFTPEELKALEEAGTHSIDVAQFVPLAAVDRCISRRPITSHRIRGSQALHALRHGAARERPLRGVPLGSHGRDHVVILRPVDNALALHQLHFAPEVQSVAALGVESVKVRDAELKLARQLIEQQSAETFDPTAFPDEVKARVEAAIQRKVEGKEVTVAVPGPAAPAGNVVDLMSALKASLERGSRASGPARAAGSAARRPPRRAPAKAADRAHPRAHRKASHS